MAFLFQDMFIVLQLVSSQRDFVGVGEQRERERERERECVCVCVCVCAAYLSRFFHSACSSLSAAHHSSLPQYLSLMIVYLYPVFIKQKKESLMRRQLVSAVCVLQIAIYMHSALEVLYA